MRHSTRALFAALLIAVLLCAALPTAARGDWTFKRGDANLDGSLNVADAIHGLSYLFSAGPLTCRDALDSNDSGALDIADAIYLLSYLFSAGPQPPPPFGSCGIDLTADALDCVGPGSACPDDPVPPPAPTLNPLFQFTDEFTITVSGAAAGAVTVAASSPAGVITAPVVGGSFNAVGIPLLENSVNNIYVTALDANGLASAPAQIMIIQDTQPPVVSVQYPFADEQVLTETIAVMGTISDLLSGVLPMTVTVNGVVATVYEGLGTTGSFLAASVPLALGTPTLLQIVGADALGNSVTVSRTVTRVIPPPGVPTLTLFSGDAQSGPVRSMLPAPITVRLLESDGSPFVGKLVEFRIDRNNGWLNADGAATGAQTFTVFTDAAGFASARWGIGSTAGQAINRVIATSADVLGAAVFCASGVALTATQINIGDGNNQFVEAGAPVPLPLRVWVSDGVNGVSDYAVVYQVVEGGGTINGLSSFPFLTMSSGHAEAVLVAGAQPGVNVVDVRLSGDMSKVATFTIYGIARDFDRPTSFHGAVLDNAQQPIGGATCSLTVGASTLLTTTSPDGQFEFSEVPSAGSGQLFIDGATATTAGSQSVAIGTFPSIGYLVVLVPNAENTLPQPILLPRLNPLNVQQFDGSQDVVLTVNGIDGLEVLVAAETEITLPNGTIVATGSGNSVPLSLNAVHHDNVPMPIPDGAAPPFAWTLQPAGAHFDPPLSIRYPNFSGLAPGSIAYFLSYNPINNRFEIVSAGTVDAEGAFINSDPGAGLTIAGWGCNCPPYAATGECCKYEPEPNGCGPADPPWAAGLVPECPYVFVWQVCFTPACDTHDICYGTCACGALTAKFACDGIFLLDLLGICAGQFTPGLPPFEVCSIQAAIYAAAVAVGGFGAFSSAQDEACRCEECGGLALGSGGGPPPPMYPDADEDILPDDWEIEVGLDPTDSADAMLDQDGDSLNNIQERLFGTLPFDEDSDDDGTTDGIELWATQPPPRVVLDETWQVVVNGQSAQIGTHGTYKVRNVSAPDQFGPSGPGSPPDFVSDDCVRAIATKTVGGVSYYATSSPFRIAQGQTIDVQGMTVSTDPPPIPESLKFSRLPGTPSYGIIEVGDTAQLELLGELADGSLADFSSDPCTTYRISNSAIATVSPTGLVAGLNPGFVLISGTNNGALASIVVRIIPAIPRTTIVGFTMLSSGAPLPGASISVVGTAFSAVSAASGQFQIVDVELTGTTLELLCSLVSGSETLQALVEVSSPVVGGYTDVGIINMGAGPAVLLTDATGSQGSAVSIDIVLDTDTALGGWSFGVCHDSAVIEITTAEAISLAGVLSGGMPADLTVVDVIPGDGVTMGVVVDFIGVDSLPPGAGYWILRAHYSILGVAGSTTDVCFCDTIGGGGAGPVATVVTGTSGTAIPTDKYCGTVTIVP
ncbi:MAG: hypothetical protein ACKVX7_00810 [Planctomycetota bacterium]